MNATKTNKIFTFIKIVVTIAILLYFFFTFFNYELIRKYYYGSVFLALILVVYLPIFKKNKENFDVLSMILALVLTIVISKFFLSDFFFLLVEGLKTEYQILIPVLGYVILFVVLLLIFKVFVRLICKKFEIRN